MKLEGKIAVVTGAYQGLGYAIAKLFLAEGAIVIGIDIHQVDQDEYRQQFPYPERIFYRVVDITKSNQVQALVSEVKNEFGTLNILVNNAGIHTVGTIEELTEEQFFNSLNVNVMGLFYMTKYFLPLLKQNSSGSSIVNVSSNLGSMGARGRIAYPTTKAAVNNFTRCMAMDYARFGVRVNAIAPGAIDTEMTRNFFKSINSEEFILTNRAMHALNRFAEPEEIARGVLFLACNDSSYMTGAVLAMDGGYTCGK